MKKLLKISVNSIKDKERSGKMVQKSLNTGIAEKIRYAREELGLTYRELGTLSGVSHSTIIKIEKNGLNPTINILFKIARALKKSMAYFFETESYYGEVSFSKRGEVSKPLIFNRGKTKVEQISKEVFGLKTRAYLITSLKGGKGDFVHHKGEELVYILEGRFKFVIGVGEYILGEGDCLIFNSQVLHYWENIYNDSGKFLMVCSIVPYWEKLRESVNTSKNNEGNKDDKDW